MTGGEARAYVGLGSNLGDPPRQIRSALQALDAPPHTRVVQRSRLYRTPPWGVADQPAFVNAVAELATALAPRELLDALLEIERRHGRRRDAARWGPRTLDLDLLTFADRRVDEPGLVLPHPRLAERAFVLVPLAEIAPDLAIPRVGVVAELLERVDASACVALEGALELDPPRGE
ncbi:MAG TPA: 2-amino-4-hydroxy-6-hydroxymethyldihydropteridine diphosphokinase [Dokdonella sp.]